MLAPHRVLAGLLLALPAAAVPPRAAAQSPGQSPPPQACPAHAPQVQVLLADPEPRLGQSLTVAGLHAISGEPRSDARYHLGLTQARFELRSTVEASVETSVETGAGTGTETGGDGVCAVPARVTVTLALADHRILIAREIPPGTCLFQEVETHERRHVAANRRLLRDAATPVRRVLLRWAAAATVRAPDAAAALVQLQDGLRQALAPTMADIQAARDVAHRAIDTPEEYRKLAQSCAGDQVRLQDRLRNP